MKVLADGPKPLNQLMEETGLSRASLFKYLAHLKGVVSHEPIIEGRRGRPRSCIDSSSLHQVSP